MSTYWYYGRKIHVEGQFGIPPGYGKYRAQVLRAAQELFPDGELVAFTFCGSSTDPTYTIAIKRKSKGNEKTYKPEKRELEKKLDALIDWSYKQLGYALLGSYYTTPSSYRARYDDGNGYESTLIWRCSLTFWKRGPRKLKYIPIEEIMPKAIPINTP